MSPKEILVGWYSTETETTKNSQDWTIQVDQYFRGYARTFGKDLAPIHLLVDVSLRKPTVGITAHMLIPNDLLIRCGGGRGGPQRRSQRFGGVQLSTYDLGPTRPPLHPPLTLCSAESVSCSPRRCR